MSDSLTNARDRLFKPKMQLTANHSSFAVNYNGCVRDGPVLQYPVPVPAFDVFSLGLT